jgi:hypothetical protein
MARFKVSLISKYAADHSFERAQPRSIKPIWRTISSSSLGKQSNDSTSTRKGAPVRTKSLITPSADIFRLLEKNHGGQDWARCKFELLVAYHSLPSEDKEDDWRSVVNDHLGQLLEQSFGVEDEESMYRELLKAIITGE